MTDRLPRRSPSDGAVELRRNMKHSTADAAVFSFSVGCGEAYFAAFVLAVGLGEAVAGLIASVPMITGAMIQLLSPRLIQWLGSHKRWVVLCAYVQSASYLPLIIGAFLGWIPAWALFIAVAIYWGAGMSTGPAWNTWITTLIPRSIRATYFAKRARAGQVGVVAGLVGAGVLLEIGTTGEAAHTLVFAVLFIVAGMSRALSARCLQRQSEPTPLPPGHRLVSFREFVSSAWSGTGGRLLLYMLCVQIAVQIAGPYFAPFILGRLEFSYSAFMMLISAAFTGRILCLPLVGRFAKRFGPANLLWLGGIGIVPLSLVWVVTDSLPLLVVLQVGTGALWACYEMATMLLLFETIPAGERTSVLTKFGAVNALALVGGSLVGAGLLIHLGEQRSTYYLLFGLSALGRLAALPLLARIHVPSFVPKLIPLRTIAVRPSAGAIDRPMLPAIDEEHEATVVELSPGDDPPREPRDGPDGAD